jgi:hypothetical protein
MRASSSRWGAISVAPSEQLRPTLKGLACSTEIQKASRVWPESVRPERSTIVPEMHSGRRMPRSSKTSSMATIAALAFSVSKMVSSSRISLPPSTRPRTCSA